MSSCMHKWNVDFSLGINGLLECHPPPGIKCSVQSASGTGAQPLSPDDSELWSVWLAFLLLWIHGQRLLVGDYPVLKY